MKSSFKYYICPACDDDVLVELPAGKYVTCYNCHAKLEIHADADCVDGMWHDRTRLSVVETEDDHMRRMLKHLTKERAFDAEDAEDWQRKSENESPA